MSALVLGVRALYSHGGLGPVLTSWQTYAAVIAGPASFFLLQKALQAGTLVASQPGFTLVNPLVSVIWGVLVFGETARTGGWLAVAGPAGVGVVAATVALVRGTEQPQPTDTRDAAARAGAGSTRDGEGR